jgi:5-deoxy-glucuronate isomerase
MGGLLRPAAAPGPDGATVRIGPAGEALGPGGFGDPRSLGWRWVSFAAHTLEPGASVRRPADNHEVALVVLEGAVRATAGRAFFEGVGSRASVFDDVPPPVLLVGAGDALEITALRPARIAIAAAPRGEVAETRLIEPATMRVEARGHDRTARTVHHLLPAEAEAGRLILFEVITPGGNWSSYPPHKHDTDDPPRERALEELYFYRFGRPAGFAVQRVYSADRSLDETVTAADGDVVLVPRGYHAVAAAAGYDCYYLNVMAGPVREWRFTVDPDHAWLMDWDPDARTS